MADNHEVYDVPKLNRSILWAIVGAISVTIAILLVLPLTQLLSRSFNRPDAERQVDIVRDPPQPPPPEAPKEEKTRELEKPQLDSQAEQLDLTQLEVALMPGMGDIQAGNFSVTGFSLGPDALGDMQIFDIAELDRIPQAISHPKFVLPPELERDNIRGKVRLKVLITPDGHVHVAGVEASDHPRLVEYARAFAEKIRYEPPVRNGQKVTTKFILPLSY